MTRIPAAHVVVTAMLALELRRRRRAGFKRLGAALVVVAALALVACHARARYLDHERRCPGGWHELVDGEVACVGAAPAALTRMR